MKKVLVVKIGAIGDVVMALPMLTYLKEQHFHVTWICGRIVAPLLEATKLIDELIIVEEKKLLKGSLSQKLGNLFKIWFQLQRRPFDLVITGHADPRYRLISRFVKAKERRSFSRENERHFPLPGRYHGNEYLRLATGVEGPNAQELKFPAFFSTPAVKRDRTVALAPGGAKNVLADDFLRRWPIAHYVKLAELLIERDFKVVLTGAESDCWCLPHFSDINFVDMIGKTDIMGLIGLYRECDLVITHDSGPLHLAKLAESPCIALFGPTNPYEKVSSQEKLKVIWGGENLSCRPCYDGKRYSQCQRNVCMEQITPESVLEKALEALNDYEYR